MSHYIIAKAGVPLEQQTINDVLREKVDSDTRAVLCWAQREDAEKFRQESCSQGSVLEFGQSQHDAFIRNHQEGPSGLALKFRIL